MRTIQRPLVGEYKPYTIDYIDLVPGDGLVLQHMLDNLQATKDLILAQPAEKLAYRFAPGEWTVKEILVHVSDTERIFAYRALRFARNDATALAGFEQDDYVPASHANERSIEDILEELTAVRMATIALFKNLPEEALTKSGPWDGSNLSVRAAAHIIAGHEVYHIKSIKQNYLSEK
ncbi:MAG TPA: DinB family protein [Ktedonosporobacter sp.]|nr:DinB family protein [Ktedonosporobacter sp.]